MRLAALLLLFLLVPVTEANACPAHVPRALGGPPKKKIAKVEPARILIVEIDLGRRFVQALEELGHEVRVARDSAELAQLTAEGRWDVAVTSAGRAKDLLENLTIAMVVPVDTEDTDFEFVIDPDPTRLKDQIAVLDRALARRNNVVAKQ